MRYFPIFVDLENRPVTVVGSGEKALRKIRLLLKTKACINVIAAEGLAFETIPAVASPKPADITFLPAAETFHGETLRAAS